MLRWGGADGGGDGWPRACPALAGRRATAVACGLGHCLAILDGRVFAWGCGGQGRLGTGDATDRETATPVGGDLARGDVVICGVACGAAHSLAVAAHGPAYAWGKNAEGQCGRGHREDVLGPAMVEAAGSVSACCGGWEHTVFLRTDGVVMTCGAGYRDARRGAAPPVLGLGGGDGRDRPEAVAALSGIDVARVACGWDHCLAVTDDGRLYTWGAGGHGKLGHGDDQARDVPTRVRGALETLRVVAAGPRRPRLFFREPRTPATRPRLRRSRATRRR